MQHPAFPEPVYSQSDRHLTCLCGAVLIPEFWRLVDDAPGLFRSANVPCFRCVGLGQATIEDSNTSRPHPLRR